MNPILNREQEEFEKLFNIPKDCPAYLEPHLKELLRLTKVFNNASNKRVINKTLEQMEADLPEETQLVDDSVSYGFNLCRSQVKELINKNKI